MTKDRIIEVLRILKNLGYPDPMIGGTAALLFYDWQLNPNDLDLYFDISKENFLKEVSSINKPTFEFDIDWNFYECEYEYQYFEFEDLKIKVQTPEFILFTIKEGINEGYFPTNKLQKHIEFLNYYTMNTIDVEINGKKVSICPKTGAVSIDGKDAGYKIDVTKGLSDIYGQISEKLGTTEKPTKGKLSLHDALSEMKEKLEDAPVEVKASFNNIVKHLDEKKSSSSDKKDSDEGDSKEEKKDSKKENKKDPDENEPKEEKKESKKEDKKDPDEGDSKKEK